MNVKVRKAGDYTYRFVYFTFNLIVGFIICHKEKWFGTSIGGTGHFKHWFEDLPAWPKPLNFDLLYCFSIGYFVEDSIEMLLRKKERDFAEMMLHHVTTISLIYFSHIINTGQIGYLILWIHLWADIFLYAARAFGDIPNHWMSTVNFGLMLLVWPYSRLYVFADLIYWASKVDF